jgi:hypothetical protein
MSVSVSVTDCVYGKPAIGLPFRLDCEVDGRASSGVNTPLARGMCRVEFDLDSYFDTLGHKVILSGSSD